MTVEETVAGSISAISLLSRHIRETKVQIETAVEEVCQSFESTATLSHRNFERTTTFLGQNDKQNAPKDGSNLEGLIETSERVLRHLLERLDEACSKSRSAIQRLNQIDERIGRVAYSLAQINEITAANRILAVNARIQAAQLGLQGTGFGVVADEITTQAKRATEFSNSISTLIDQLREAVSLSREDLLEAASHDRDAMNESEREVVRTHTDFRKFLDHTHEFLTEAAGDSRKVTQDIHSSVRGLQFQDRASQRLEFIAGELGRIGEQLTISFEFDLETGDGHPSIGEMMTRTSMKEQRVTAACASTGDDVDVELF